MTETMTAAEYLERALAHGHAWRKYRNVPTTVGAEHFDSKREAARHQDLLTLQRAGNIQQLERQVTFPLVVNGVKVGSIRPDWTYIEDGVVVADDCKGHQTDVHKLRWKLAKACYPQILWRLS
jgi:hypothetical protein